MITRLITHLICVYGEIILIQCNPGDCDAPWSNCSKMTTVGPEKGIVPLKQPRDGVLKRILFLYSRV